MLVHICAVQFQKNSTYDPQLAVYCIIEPDKDEAFIWMQIWVVASNLLLLTYIIKAFYRVGALFSVMVSSDKLFSQKVESCLKHFYCKHASKSVDITGFAGILQR